MASILFSGANSGLQVGTSNAPITAEFHLRAERTESRSRDEEMQKIVLWIGSLSFSAKHIDVLESVQPGTGTWLLEHATFRSWVKGNIEMLWCPGIPGAGKTRLVSLIIDHLEQQRSSPDSIHTYIYCDYNQRKEQTAAALLSSLLQQVLQRSDNNTLPPEVLLLYNLHKKYGTRPTLTQVADILRNLALTFRTFHVVVDALDECAESEEDALQFVKALSSIGPQIKVLCTSRFSTIFAGYFARSEKLELSAQSEDIRVYLESQIEQRFRLSRHVRTDPSLQDEIINTIIEESQGMFLLAKLHIESLSTKINRKGVRSSLRTLPSTLDATYSDALQRIYSQDPDAVDLAETILFWIICARRALTVVEMQHMYATHQLPQWVALEDDDLPDVEILTSVCSGLILIDGESQTIRPIHYTVLQYFERTHSHKLTEARRNLTLVSLAYLTLPNFSAGICPDDTTMAERLEKYPFLDYAAKHWGSEGEHLADNFPSEIFYRLASNPTAVEMTNQAWSLGSARYSNWSQEFSRRVPVLVLTAAFSLPGILRQMVLDGHDIEGKGRDGETALIRAAACGHAVNVRVLLDLGAAVEARDYMDETALQRAVRNGEEAVIRVLLAGGADVNTKTSSDWTALMSGVSSGSLETVQMLVEAGANWNAETVWGDSALSIATRNGPETIATFLADSGAILPRGPAGRRASIAASRRGLQRLVRRLTMDYDGIANRPLERQSSQIMRGLSGIRETSGRQSEPQDDQFSDIMENLRYNVGFLKRYRMFQQLGKGNFATVYACINKVTGVKYAVKVFQARGLMGYETLLNEITSMRENQHVNIVHLVDVFAEYTERTVSLVLEIALEGDLFNYIVGKKKLTEMETRKLFSQLFSALEYLHDGGWVHRDIKPENLLLANTENLILKVADFGIAKKIGSNQGRGELATTLCGTPSYVAPEILAETRRQGYGFPVDVWSSGVVLYICLCGFPPFSDELYTEENPYSLAMQIKLGLFDFPSPYWDSVTDLALDLIDSMVVVDMDRRHTVKQCISHPWMLYQTPQILDDGVRSASPDPIPEPSDSI